MDAGTALIQGLANGDVNAAVANASAPYIANIIAKEIGKDNKAGLLAAHAIANVALALAKDYLEAELFGTDKVHGFIAKMPLDDLINILIEARETLQNK